MTLFVLSFLLGNVWVQTLTELPSKTSIISLLGFALILLFFSRKKSYFVITIIGLLLGSIFTIWYAQARLSWCLAKEWEGQTVNLKGYVASIPLTELHQTRFKFLLREVIFKGEKQNVNVYVQLTWRDCKVTLHPGDLWTLHARMKRIHTVQNPGTFDAEAFALQNGSRARGTIVNHAPNKKLAHSYHFPIEQVREIILTRILHVLPHSHVSHWLLALMMGERRQIPQEHWQILRNTGTNHLMAIAGLHIGALVGFTIYLIHWLWCRSTRLLLWIPAKQASVSVAWIAAICYAALAGFSIPTQRACIMLSVGVLALLLRIKTNPWVVWSQGLLLVLIVNPLSVLSESFWLSFGTIAIIIMTMRGRIHPGGWWWHYGRIQWIVGIGLIPLSIYFFQQLTLVSFVANTIAIPWVAFLILPFCFVALIFLFLAPNVSLFCLYWADRSLALLWQVLSQCAKFKFASYDIALPDFTLVILLVIGMIALLLPRGMPGKWLTILFFLPCIFHEPTTPSKASYWLTILDVGQGLSIVVQTQNHTLLYDAGPRYNAEADLGERVVYPYLIQAHVKHLDKVVVSHGDNDHSGGIVSVLKHFNPTDLVTSVPAKLKPMPARLCLAGEKWTWDGVHFSFLYPTQDQLDLGNNSSCVLKIENEFCTSLLTGDIEKLAEQSLLKHQSGQLPAMQLVAPHHGSKTSGLHAFIETVHPKYVIYATGYRNQYHFPHPSVTAYYDKIGALQLNTANSGAITFRCDPTNRGLKPEQYRLLHHRYWHD
ncbi:MAG: DNA internalization-related competence protein ComEC/Rec2 [Gammaproteobacteria bacterium]|nr:DNA internalization-related competence protein ComEC/Rec2 [Gammaproteobacteria bacterium]